MNTRLYGLKGSTEAKHLGVTAVVLEALDAAAVVLAESFLRTSETLFFSVIKLFDREAAGWLLEF